MQIVVDFILLAVSGVATVYCFVLSRRLARLNDMKNGIGASIATMSQALDQTQQVLLIAKNASLEGVERLTSVLEEAERVGPEIRQLLKALGELAEVAADDIEKARATAVSDIEENAASILGDEFVYLEDDAPPARGRRAA